MMSDKLQFVEEQAIGQTEVCGTSGFVSFAGWMLNAIIRGDA